jgi:spore coat polysaccharide biosynthesis protein SpsF
VIRSQCLIEADDAATDPYEREHVTPFVYRRPGRFRLAGVTRDEPMPQLRWTVDVPGDLDFVRGVYAALYPANSTFGSDDIMALTVNSAPAPHPLAGTS